jgi:hypothetical protein
MADAGRLASVSTIGVLFIKIKGDAGAAGQAIYEQMVNMPPGP